MTTTSGSPICNMCVVGVFSCLDGPHFSKVDSIFTLWTLSDVIGGGVPGCPGPFFCTCTCHPRSTFL